MVVMVLIEVELGDIKKVEKEFADLLKQRLKTDVTIKGGKLLLDQTGGHVSPKEAKEQVKHALRHMGLQEGYRVLSEHHIIRIEKLIEKKRHKFRKEGEAPVPSRSMPYFFPS
jgi:hypothetical protein